MRLIISRLGRLVFVVALVSFFTFLLLDSAPGDPAVALAGLNASDEVVAEVRADLGLDRPFIERYLSWLGNAITGDLGESYRTLDVSASSLIRSAIPNTLELMVLAQIMALAMAVPAAIAAARRPGGFLDRVSSSLAFAFLAAPTFVLGIYLSYILAVRLSWLPTVATDLPPLTSDPLGNLEQMFLPSFTLALGLVAVYLRLLRNDLVSALQEDYVLLAQARGVPDRRILWLHALRPSSLNLLTAVGLTTGALIGGTLVVEILFAVPGMGRLMVTAVFGEDYSVVMGAALVFTVGYVLVNFFVDLIYFALDPRIRDA
jgi:peptide/nickel transport system permease protein